jgi:hypothetical protein
VGPRTGQDDVKERKFLSLPGFEPCPHGRLARSQSNADCAIPDRLSVIKYESLREYGGSSITMFVQNYIKIVDVFTSLKIFSAVFEITTQCSLVGGINISEEHASSIFKAIS